MGRAIPLLPLWDFVACSRVIFTFTFTFYKAVTWELQDGFTEPVFAVI
jgi:hypothetical protein